MPALYETSTFAADGVRQLLNTPRVSIDSHLDDPRWQLASRIAVSGRLGRSRPLARFLLFIVDRHIRGRDEEITEQQIGMLIFDRPDRYDSNEDNIVRTYARTLRRRIGDYYAAEGLDELFQLDIPRGGYTPVFTSRDLSRPAEFLQSVPLEVFAADGPDTPSCSSEGESGGPTEALQETETSPSIAQQRGIRIQLHAGHHWLIALGVGILIGISLTVLQLHLHAKQSGLLFTNSGADSLWRTMFASDRNTYVVPSDVGLVIMQRLTERPVPLASYISGTYRDNPLLNQDPASAEIAKLGGRRYTSVVDLDFVAHLEQIDAVDPARMVIRYARDLRMDDLRTGNAILVGSTESNPWVQIFESQLNFQHRISKDPSVLSGFVNSHPHPGEHEIYGTIGNDHSYGLIALLPNLTSTGNILIVGGLNTAGTQAATTFLLTPSLLAPLLHDAAGRHGHLLPFEALIRTDSFASNAASPHLIAERINGQ